MIPTRRRTTSPVGAILAGGIPAQGRAKWQQNIMILAGHDFDDAKQRFHGAGTFYALQSFRQLIVKTEES
jgi:hypothetical protein